MKNTDRPHRFEDDSDEIDEVEILEVIGVDDDADVPTPETRDSQARRREVVLAFEEPTPADEDSLIEAETAPRIPSWGAPPVPRESDPPRDLDLVQRLRADYENLRKRVDREKADFELRASIGLVTRLLPILDGFDRALSLETRFGVDDAVRDGLVMIQQQLRDALREEGLRPIAATGEVFDPNLHEAVATDSKADVPRNVIIEELRRGYLFRDRVLRHALVKVSTNGHEPDGEGESA